jgi:hypothetical protein
MGGVKKSQEQDLSYVRKVCIFDDTFALFPSLTFENNKFIEKLLDQHTKTNVFLKESLLTYTYYSHKL